MDQRPAAQEPSAPVVTAFVLTVCRDGDPMAGQAGAGVFYPFFHAFLPPLFLGGNPHTAFCPFDTLLCRTARTTRKGSALAYPAIPPDGEAIRGGAFRVADTMQFPSKRTSVLYSFKYLLTAF